MPFLHETLYNICIVYVIILLQRTNIRDMRMYVLHRFRNDTGPFSTHLLWSMKGQVKMFALVTLVMTTFFRLTTAFIDTTDEVKRFAHSMMSHLQSWRHICVDNINKTRLSTGKMLLSKVEVYKVLIFLLET